MQKYDVALSFAAEDRQYAKTLANLLEADGYKPFYDENELANLWGKNLYDYLSSVYKDQARYCVMFLSKHYYSLDNFKFWTILSFLETKSRKEGILSIYIFLKG